jgi:hypothetical protein
MPSASPARSAVIASMSASDRSSDVTPGFQKPLLYFRCFPSTCSKKAAGNS